MEETLTVSVAIGSEVDIQSPQPDPLQDDCVLLEGADGQQREGDRVATPGGEGETQEGTDATGIPNRLHRFYFESDSLVLKNNVDYQKLLKTLALLEAQKMQATKDMEQLIVIKSKAERDPTGFVTALKNGTLEPLPTRQHVAELPDINWKSYTDSVERIVRQHSSVYQRTRRKGLNKEAATLTKIESTSKLKDKPPSYKKPWTPEEQMRLEELLRTHPPEAIERRRYEKIAKALGTRTSQQVASHVQKYFIKLAKAGLPVPGRMPNTAAYASKSKKGGRLKRLARLSTFFSTMAPRVLMSGEGGEALSSSYSPTPPEEGETGEMEEEESSDSDDSTVAEWIPTRESNQHITVKCVSCQILVTCGRYWECCDCPATYKTLLCPDCVNCDYLTPHHSPAHEMIPHTLPTAHIDQDYSNFSQNTHTKYNYLDPNFFPAS